LDAASGGGRADGPVTLQHFRGTGKPFSTYECIVYGLEGGRVREQTVFMNFFDVYVQAGLSTHTGMCR